MSSSAHWFLGRFGSAAAEVVVASGVAVIVSGPVGVGVAAGVLVTVVVGATVTVGDEVGRAACDPHPVSTSTDNTAAAEAAPPRNRIPAR